MSQTPRLILEFFAQGLFLLALRPEEYLLAPFPHHREPGSSSGCWRFTGQNGLQSFTLPGETSGWGVCV